MAPRERASAAERRIEEPRGARAGLGHVDVRVRAIRDEPVAARHHRARHVRVQIEARDHRHAVADHPPHPPEQLALAVVEMLGHHRTVQIEVDGVERAVRLEPADDLARDPLVRVASHVGRRAGGRPGEPDAPVAERGELADRAGGRDVRAVDGRRDCVAERHPRPAAAPLERLVVGLARSEGVGFVLEAADCDASHVCGPMCAVRCVRSDASVPGSVRSPDGSGQPSGIHRRGQRMHRSGACLWPRWGSAIVPASTPRELRHDAVRPHARVRPPHRRRRRPGTRRSEGPAHRAALQPRRSSTRSGPPRT